MSALILAIQIIIAVALVAAIAYGVFVAVVTPEINWEALDAQIAERAAAGWPKKKYTSIFNREVYDYFYWLPTAK